MSHSEPGDVAKSIGDWGSWSGRVVAAAPVGADLVLAAGASGLYGNPSAGAVWITDGRSFANAVLTAGALCITPLRSGSRYLVGCQSPGEVYELLARQPFDVKFYIVAILFLVSRCHASRQSEARPDVSSPPFSSGR